MIVVRDRKPMFDSSICSLCELSACTVVVFQSDDRPSCETSLAFCRNHYAVLQSNINAYTPPNGLSQTSP